MKSQMILAIACLAVGFGSAYVLHSDFSIPRVFAAEPSVVPDAGRGQGRARGGSRQAAGGGGHSHGPQAPAGSQAAKHIETQVAKLSRAYRLGKGERRALRLALRKQNFQVRRGLQEVQALLVRYAHAPDAEKTALRDKLVVQLDAVLAASDRGRDRILREIPENRHAQFLTSEANRDVYFFWLGK